MTDDGAGIYVPEMTSTTCATCGLDPCPHHAEIAELRRHLIDCVIQIMRGAELHLRERNHA